MILTASLLVVGCHHHPTMREMGIVLDTLRVTHQAPIVDTTAIANDSLKLSFFNAETDSMAIPSSFQLPSCRINIELITLGNKEYSDINDSLMRSGILAPEYLSLTNLSLSPKEAVDSFIKRYETDYQTFYAGIYSLKEDTADFSIGFTLRTEIHEGMDSVLCYTASITNQQGAVVTQYSVCRNIDLHHGKILHFDDIFVHGATEGLSEAIASQLMKQSGNKTLTALRQAGFFINTDIYPTHNFLLEEDAIIFVYVPGEICDRDKGEIKVEIPYSQLKRLMKR